MRPLLLRRPFSRFRCRETHTVKRGAGEGLILLAVDTPLAFRVKQD